MTRTQLASVEFRTAGEPVPGPTSMVSFLISATADDDVHLSKELRTAIMPAISGSPDTEGAVLFGLEVGVGAHFQGSYVERTPHVTTDPTSGTAVRNRRWPPSSDLANPC